MHEVTVLDSPRVARLRARLENRSRQGGAPLCSSESQRLAFEALAYEAYAPTADQPEVVRKAAFLSCFARRMPIDISDDELIVGSQAFCPFTRYRGALSDEQRRLMAFHGNIGHIVVDYGRVLRQGIPGLREAVATMPTDGESARRNRNAFGTALEAFDEFIGRHAQAAAALAETAGFDRGRELARLADICEGIRRSPPRSFHQALQLVWFTQVFLHAESSAAAVSFGRLDQYLWPYLEHDFQSAALCRAEAEELLACFWLKCCEGDESQNLMVGGVDESGRNAENPLSLLCLETAARLGVWQPSVSVRIAPDTSPEFWQAALELCAQGTGQPSFFNDPVVIDSLQAVDIPLPRARDWAVVGCYEATPQGDAYPLTVCGFLSLPNALLEFLGTADDADSFESFLEGFKRHLDALYTRRLADFEKHWATMSALNPSPFESLCVTGCIESGLTAEEGGARFNLYGVNIMGLGTLVDSLLVVKELVFGRRTLTMQDLRRQLEANFPDEALCRLCRGLPGKFGSDAVETNRLASELSRWIADRVLDSRLPHGVRPCPAFFRFSGDVFAPVPATPDGRRANDRISYGAGAGIHVAGMSATSLLSSAAHVAHDRCACGNPIALSIGRKDIQGPRGLERLKHLIETYFRQGGFHLHINIVDARRLRQAQAEPEAHGDLIVRISGFSARFTAIDRRWQDAIVERTEKGM